VLGDIARLLAQLGARTLPQEAAGKQHRGTWTPTPEGVAPDERFDFALDKCHWAQILFEEGAEWAEWGGVYWFDSK
jgi:hypothetical protein